MSRPAELVEEPLEAAHHLFAKYLTLNAPVRVWSGDSRMMIALDRPMLIKWSDR